MRALNCLFLVLLYGGTMAVAQQSQEDSPREWIDKETGHRIVRLSDETGSRTLYFHDNAYTPEGDKFIFTTPRGVACVEVAKIGTDEQRLDIIVPFGRGPMMARRTRELYIAGAGTNRTRGPVYAVNVDTKEQRLIPHAPTTVLNCDETISFTVVRGQEAIDPTGKVQPPPKRPYVPQLHRMFPGKKPEDLTPDQRYSVEKEEGLARRTYDPPASAYRFIDLKTGEARIVGHQYGNLNHHQFNPKDPNLLLFCHEGTWHEVDRTWTIRTDAGSAPRLVHKRTMDMEINGHEWWSWDGKTVWFDLQTPRSEDFWIAGVNVETGKQTRYHITRDTWGVHFNSSRDDTLFAGDGGDPSQVAYSTDGMWITLFRVQPDGTLAPSRLVNMKSHNYVTGQRGGVEPNNSITPDNKWVIFTGQFARDQRHVYAVEIAKRK